MPAAEEEGTVERVYRRVLVLVCFAGLALGMAYVGTGMLENALRAMTPDAVPSADSDPSPEEAAASTPSEPTPSSTAPEDAAAGSDKPTFTAGFVVPVADDAVARINAERIAAGLPPLRVDPVLVEEASFWAEQMTRNGYVHSSQERLVSIQGKAGTGGLAENLHAPEVQCAAAISCAVPEAHPTSGVLHVDWMRSREHRSTVLDPAWDRIGIGVYCDASGRMWATALFAAPVGVGVSGDDVVDYREPSVDGNDGVTCGGFFRGHNPAWRHTDVS